MEIWKEVKNESVIDFDYEVSNYGNVRSLNYNRTGKTQNLKIRTTPKGNRCVLLAGNKVRSVPQLVLGAFVALQPTDKHRVHHKDGDCTNDHLDNLEWQHMSIQNTINGEKGSKFQKGHEFRFKKGNPIGIENRFKKGNQIGVEFRFKKKERAKYRVTLIEE
jgi:NUMOD4 motif